MAYLLDTNTCIRFLNGTSEAVREHFETAVPTDLILCSIVKAELLFGAFKSARPEQNRRQLDQFFSGFVSLPFDDTAAAIAGQVRKDLASAGTPIGPHDLLIAAIAVANNLTLVTHNTREFQRVSNLRVEDWEL